MADVYFLCTGNAARSVMASAALRARLPDLVVDSGGTLAIDGLPMSWRTQAAIEHVGLAPPAHRSHQATATDVLGATLIVGLAPEHVAWIRREHPGAAGRTATLRRLSRDLATAPGADLAGRVRSLELATVVLEPWEEVEDPAGGEAPQFVACAEEIAALVDSLAAAIDAAGPS